MIIEIYPVTFKRLLEGLSNQFLKQRRAKCKSDDFGAQMSAEAKKFFSVVVRESKLPPDIAALAILVDNSRRAQGRRTYTFVIFIDISKTEIATDDLQEIFVKLVLAHEICHFAFYYELF
jgi:hypothetical protein